MKLFKTLKNSKEYLRTFKQAKNFHTFSFVMYYARTKECKVGFIASKKVGNAVHRNRCKRLLREIFYQSEDDLPIGNYVLVAKKGLLSTKFIDAKSNYDLIIKKLKLNHTKMKR